MASLSQGVSNLGNCCILSISGHSGNPLLLQPRSARNTEALVHGRIRGTSFSLRREFSSKRLEKVSLTIPRCSNSSKSGSSQDDSSSQGKAAFGYTRKDVLLIGVGFTVSGIVLKYGLEFAGVDPLQAGNVVQLVLVLGLTVGWISTYIFRVSNKEMTYAQQLRDYEDKVMEKRLEGLTEAELEALLEQVEEEKTRLGKKKQVKS